LIYNIAMPAARKNTNRIEKVNSLIQKLLGEIIHGYRDNLAGLVTISKVETSRDMKWTKVWISIVGGDDDKIFASLEKNLYHIQGELNRALTMKIVPRIQLALDTAPRYAQHINELIKKIHEEDEA